MSTLFSDSAVYALIWVVVKASILLAITALVQLALRRRASAATRHLVWTFGIVSILLLPAVSGMMPEWPVPILTAPPTATMVVPVDRVDVPVDVSISSAPSAPAVDTVPGVPAALSFATSTVLLGVYFAGVIVMLLHLLLQHVRACRFARRATAVRDADWIRMVGECARTIGLERRPVRLLRSREHSVPLTFGTRRPAIVIPAIADSWTEDRRRAVVLHEMAHVVRYDCLTQTMGAAARAMYWCHPGVWLIVRRLRIERELACDDRVIAAGTEAREYAGHLLEIAYSFRRHRAPALAVSMARPRQLEGRLLAALDAARNRSVPAFSIRLAGTAVGAALLLALATATPIAGPNKIEAIEAADETPSPDVTETRARLRDLAQVPLRGLKEIAAAVGIQQEGLPGTWEVRPTETKGIVHLRLVELNSSSGWNVPIEQLEGLTGAQLAGPGGPVTFRVRRDAGTFTFEGIFRSGVGAGTFTFAADANFPAELAKRGFARPSAAEQYQLARHDIGFAFVDELSKQGYAKPQTSELVRAGQHGVRVDYLRDMAALGYRLGSLDPLITLRDHGVTPAYVRDLAGLGYKGLAADDIRNARDHGITPEYIRGIRDAGYASLQMAELIKVRDHGITPEFVRELGDAGYSKLPLDQLLRVKDHGVSPEYVREMKRLGYSLPIDELVLARDHGISVEYVRDMAALGYASLPMETVIRLRDHGVTPQYAQDLKSLGYDRLPYQDLITLRDHGLTPDRIRAANARAGTRLPIDLLRSLVSGGMR